MSATIGSVVGALILYLVGKLIPIEHLKEMLKGKVGQTLHLSPQDLGKASIWFAKHGNVTVFFCRFIPIIRSLISIPAGIANMNLAMFLLLTTFGTLIWNSILVWLGVLAGESWENIVQIIGTYSSIAVVTMGILGLIFIGIFIKRRFSQN